MSKLPWSWETTDRCDACRLGRGRTWIRKALFSAGLGLVALAAWPIISAAQTPDPPATTPDDAAQPAEAQGMTIHRAPFGTTHDGTAVDLFTLTNAHGHIVQLTNYGAIIVSVQVPDRQGQLANVTLGFPELAGYLERHPYFGATVGRYCNRIAAGKFTLDGKTYTLVVNNGPNHLHGGTVGFDKLIWEASEIRTGQEIGVRFSVRSPDGQEGYPGNLDVVAEYTWNDANELSYTFSATTDQATVVNLTNHAYWNLNGAGNGTILDHVVQLMSDQYLAVDDSLIPTGQLASVEGTPLDFREPHRIGERIEMLPATSGYDHCFVINGPAGELRACGNVHDPASGRSMQVLTTQPGVQLYTGNHLGGSYSQHSGLCLETQHYPDSPNRPEFPSTRLDPGQTYQQKTVHRFSVQ